MIMLMAMRIIMMVIGVGATNDVAAGKEAGEAAMQELETAEVPSLFLFWSHFYNILPRCRDFLFFGHISITF